VLREERADVDHLTVEGFAFLSVVARLNGEDLTQYVRFKYSGVNPAIRTARVNDFETLRSGV
jgi:hypothetical protein